MIAGDTDRPPPSGVAEANRKTTARATDMVSVGLLFALGFVIATRYIAAFERAGGRAEFYQAEFAAAVAHACGRGFLNVPAPPPALADFLERRTDVVSCAQLPSALVTAPPDITQSLYRYLMTSIALYWRITGIKWSGLGPLYGILYGSTLCVTYALFRVVFRPFAAWAGVLPLAVSAQQLSVLPHVRDYAKAPFLLALFAIMAMFASRVLPDRARLALAAGFGLVLGLGFGFRNDLLVVVPAFVAVVALLVPGFTRRDVQRKAVCLGVAFVMFLAAAWPIVTAYSSGSNTGHVTVLGLMAEFDGRLGLTRPPYSVGELYNDRFAAVTVNAISRVATGRFVELLSPAYDKTAMALAGTVARHWPADAIARGLASALHVLDLGFSPGRFTDPIPRGIPGSSASAFYDAYTSLLQRLTGLGPFLFVIAVLIVVGRSLRAGAALAIVALYFCAYPAIQFDLRHFFHLEFIGWASLLFVATAIVGVRWKGGWTRTTVARAVVRIALAGVLAIVAPAVALAASRAYQQRHVTGLIQAYVDAGRTPVNTSKIAGANQTLFSLEAMWQPRDRIDPVAVKYLVAEFGGGPSCPASDLPVTVQYTATKAFDDFSMTVRVPIDAAQPTLKFVPAYYNGSLSHFSGFALPVGYEDCLRMVSAVDDLARFPILLELTLAPGWQREKLFQRLTMWEPVSVSRAFTMAAPRHAVVPAPTEPARLVIDRPDLMTSGVEPSRDGRGWRGRVAMRAVEGNLLRFPPSRASKGDVLRVTGALRRGGLAVGLIRNGLWATNVSVTMRGEFHVALEAPSDDEYGVLVTDFSPMPWRQTRGSPIRRAAWWLFRSALVDDFDVTRVEWVSGRRPSP